MAQLSNVVKEVLAAETIEEFRTLVDKHKGFMVTAYEAMVLNAHKTYLFTKRCRETSKADVTAFAECVMSRRSKIDED